MSNILLKKTTAVLLLLFLSSNTLNERKEIPSVLNITFENFANNHPVVLRDSVYTNKFGEKYRVTKLRYYISNICLKSNSADFKESDSYHLIDENKSGSKSFSFAANTRAYDSITFLIGVDSLRNVSGAQTGALDPVNDMFWTWNSGYVMMKFEGNSSSSKQVNQKFEYHIGGYSGKNNVVKRIAFALPRSIFKTDNDTAKIIITCDLDKWWDGSRTIKIEEHAVVTTPGPLAVTVSENYQRMFSIDSGIRP